MQSSKASRLFKQKINIKRRDAFRKEKVAVWGLMSELFLSYVPADTELFNTPACRRNLTIFTEYKQTRKYVCSDYLFSQYTYRKCNSPQQLKFDMNMQ